MSRKTDDRVDAVFRYAMAFYVFVLACVLAAVLYGYAHGLF